MNRARPRSAAGFTLIEILVTLLILVLGLLGLIGLQTRGSAIEFESHQRGQALTIVRDMQARLLSSRGIVSGFLDPAVSSTDGSVYFGSGQGAASFVDADGDCLAPAAGDVVAEAKFQACTWGRDLQGVSVQDKGAAVGAMVGARGCVVRVVPPAQNALADLYIVVVWQGVEARAEPPAESPAGLCAGDVDFGTGLRRGVSLRVLVPDLRKG